MDKKIRIQKILDSLPKRFYFEKVFESSSRNKILEDINLCYKKTKENNLFNCSPLLTREQEEHLFRKLNYLKYRITKLTLGFEESKDGPKYSKPVNIERLGEKSLKEIERLIRTAQETRNIIIKSNLRLIFKRVHRYHSSDTFERDEFFSNGYCHVLKAVDLFDYRMGYKFSTYCTRVLQSNLHRDYINSKRQQEKLSENKIVAVDEKGSDFSFINDKYNKAFLHSLLEKLKENKKIHRPDVKIKVLKDYYGIDSEGVGKTLKEIGSELHITRERVRQIKLEALKYLNKNCPLYDPLC
jgi:RNA polymerase sigma factor (sigma-70 family)